MVNQLSKETSPYLLEHATNPVNWYAWNDEAFNLAKDENKMIFVSVGYSACHWCHVMRHESFENDGVAKILNENFVSIKVDREERPDIDHLLQFSFQLMNGRGGGWPLSIFMTPDKKPFYSGTYFPLNSKYGMPGFMDVLKAVIKAYSTKINDIQEQSQQIEHHLKAINRSREKYEINRLSNLDIIGYFSELYDSEYGGFGSSPKFPSGTSLYLLLHVSALTNNSPGLKMVYKTLDNMINGGIYDQIGGGFHRYSVDEKWLVPHFEKMLYNQSLMIYVLIEAYRLSKNNLYLEKTKEILQYIIREMVSPEGGFYSSSNADSEGIEGKYFVWTKDELNFLTKDDLEIICDFYDITKRGNWEGKNILHIKSSISTLAKKYTRSTKEIIDTLANARKKILAKRLERISPEKDTKIITSWNSLMIKAFLQAIRIIEDPEDKTIFLKTAQRGINHIIDMIENGYLYRISIDGKKNIIGFLDDYQFTISALLDFYEMTLEEKYFQTAKTLFSFSIDNFYDADNGGFYYSLKEHDTIITRFKDFYDSPLPSANAFAIQNALRFSFFDNSQSEFFFNITKSTLHQIVLSSSMDVISLASMIYSSFLFLDHFTEVTLSFKSSDIQLHTFINEVWIPYRLQIDYESSRRDSNLEEKEFLRGKKLTNEQISVYICKNHVCSLPLTNKNQILQYLDNLYPNGMFNFNTQEKIS